MRRTLLVIGILAAATTALAQEATPELSWHDTQGNTQSISQYRGRIILLNFWATWCIPCQHEMPMLEDMQRKYGEKSLIVLGGSVDDASSQSHIQPFAEKDKISFPLLVGTTAQQMKELQLGEAIPATAFFDADGKLVARVLGELDKSELQHRIEWMLGKHRGKEPAAFVNGFQKKPKSERQPNVFAH